MITLFRFLQAVQISFDIFLRRPGGAVDALQHFVFGIAAPIGAGDLGQLEGTNTPGGRQMWPAAEIDEVSLTVEADILISRNAGDDFCLIMLARLFKMFDRAIARPYFATDFFIAFNYFSHARFDCFEIVRRERLGAREIVIEAIFDCRADGNLSIWI